MSLGCLERFDLISGVLAQKNRLLLESVRQLQGIVQSCEIPSALEPYRDEVLKLSRDLQVLIEENLLDLQEGLPETIEDILSNTQQATRYVRILSSLFLSPLVRPRVEDILCLKLITWMHRSHRATERFPAAFTDGPCAIRPMITLVPLYSFPHLEQRGLLFLPLLFHEFGHLLYRCQKPEMDDLVQDFQRQVGDLLFPASLRNDRYSEEQFSRRQNVMDIWYYWAQEMYCDAVGFRMGSLGYLYAFSEHLGLVERGDFYRDLDDLERSTHPVTWIRVKMLARLAMTAGFEAEGETVLEQWKALAATLQVEEDYHGFFDDRLIEPLEKTIGDMIEESSPVAFDNTNSTYEYNPPVVLNQAWLEFLNLPGRYSEWEQSEIRRIVPPSP